MQQVATARYPSLAAAFAAKFGVTVYGEPVAAARESARSGLISAIRAPHWGDAERFVGSGFTAA